MTAQHNKSMDVRAKQRLSYHVVSETFACVYSVSPHVISIVMPLYVKVGNSVKISFLFRYFCRFYFLLFSQAEKM